MSTIRAILFDQDGVIIDTEKEGHRVAFNETFKAFGYPFQWGVEEYHQLLQVGGGKERMRHYLHTQGFGREVKPEEEDELIQKLHFYKTDKFISLIESGRLPLRPGIRRLMHEAMEAGLTLGICTTSNEKAAQAIVHNILKDIRFEFVLAGDVVKKKKPDPEIYNLALSKTAFEPAECVVVEDSRIGILAAKAAGMHVIATPNDYTVQEDLSAADLIVSCLGDPSEKGKILSGSDIPGYDGLLHVQQIVQYFG